MFFVWTQNQKSIFNTKPSFRLTRFPNFKAKQLNRRLLSEDCALIQAQKKVQSQKL